MIVPVLSGMLVSAVAITVAWLLGRMFLLVPQGNSPATVMILGVLSRMVFFLGGFLILKQTFDEYQLKFAILSGVAFYFLLSLGPWFLKSNWPSRIR